MRKKNGLQEALSAMTDVVGHEGWIQMKFSNGNCACRPTKKGKAERPGVFVKVAIIKCDFKDCSLVVVVKPLEHSNIICHEEYAISPENFFSSIEEIDAIFKEREIKAEIERLVAPFAKKRRSSERKAALDSLFDRLSKKKGEAVFAKLIDDDHEDPIKGLKELRKATSYTQMEYVKLAANALLREDFDIESWDGDESDDDEDEDY
jgi:uncharacterized small protein (DUF1192 family)